MSRPIRKDYKPRFGSEIHHSLEQLVERGDLRSGESPYLSKLFYYGMAERKKISNAVYEYRPSERARECIALLQQQREKQLELWKEEEFFEFF